MDISFSNGFGVENTLFIKHLFEIKAEAKKLFYHIRIWFKENNLELKSYLLKVLVIFYLQTQGFMPSVKKIQDRLPPRNIGGQSSSLLFSYLTLFKILLGINVAYDKNSKRNTDGCHSFLSYKPHIRPFFIFYANYDFRQYIICPYLGKSVAKVGCTNELMEHIIT